MNRIPKGASPPTAGLTGEKEAKPWNLSVFLCITNVGVGDLCWEKSVAVK